MSLHSPVMAVLPEDGDSNFANQIANSLGYPYADVIMGSPMQAAVALASREHSPAYIIIDIGTRTGEVINEIDQLAESCEAGTRVIVIGRINDIKFYRELTQLGVLEYFTHPVDLQEVKTALMAGRGGDAGDGKKVVTFMSAASGDGSSTLAMNVAYSMATDYRKKVVLVDMDYQFGMVAKNLDLNTQFGIKEIFDHPDRGVDPTLVRRMISPYGDNLSVIAAPEELKYLPDMNPETIRGLIATLKSEYDCVVIDLPHIWSNWTASTISASTDIVLVSQLWLRSITHAARLLGLWRNMGISDDMVKVAINRSGAKFKEGISDKDFERVCSHAIDYSVANDIKTIVAAESQGQMIMEVSQSMLASQLKGLAGMLMGLSTDAASLKSSDGRFSLFKK
ncbi:MAG: AAA family ATPase [Rickettsiales bacterium]|nr:AAA family ATPase [Rickettsiales bacterium]